MENEDIPQPRLRARTRTRETADAGATSDEYSVGYGRPPRHTQFKKGQSGNRKGRPKGAKNSSAMLDELLGERIVVREGGRSAQVSKLEAVLKRLVSKALAGDHRAISKVIEMHAESLNRIGNREAQELLGTESVFDKGDEKALDEHLETLVADRIAALVRKGEQEDES